jgi:predicted component of type VI protein secretion system
LQDTLWFVRDLDSGNGTFLNGRKLAGSAPLKRGDEISFGKFSLFFDHVPAEPAAPLYIPRTGHAEPGRTLVMRPEELAKIRASVVEKRRAHVRWQAGGDEGTFTLTDGEVVIGRDQSPLLVPPEATLRERARVRSRRPARLLAPPVLDRRQGLADVPTEVVNG